MCLYLLSTTRMESCSTSMASARPSTFRLCCPAWATTASLQSATSARKRCWLCQGCQPVITASPQSTALLMLMVTVPVQVQMATGAAFGAAGAFVSALAIPLLSWHPSTLLSVDSLFALFLTLSAAGVLLLLRGDLHACCRLQLGQGAARDACAALLWAPTRRIDTGAAAACMWSAAHAKAWWWCRLWSPCSTAADAAE